MANGKNMKRQRKKEMRRAKIEQELKARQAARRKQRLLLLLIVGIVAAGVAYAMSDRESENNRNSAAEDAAAPTECTETKPPGGDTDTPDNPPPMTIDKAKKYTAVFDTSCGTLEAELAADLSPNTVNSFVFLARQGFYNGLTFHRIVKDFAVQGGDPKGDGTGGPNYKTVDPPPPGYKYEKGAIAMAKGGPEAAGTAGSQFFFVPAEGASLEPIYAVLGKVVKGDDVLAKLNQIPTKSGASGEKSTPSKPVYIEKISIRESAAD